MKNKKFQFRVFGILLEEDIEIKKHLMYVINVSKIKIKTQS